VILNCWGLLFLSVETDYFSFSLIPALDFLPSLYLQCAGPPRPLFSRCIGIHSLSSTLFTPSTVFMEFFEILFVRCSSSISFLDPHILAPRNDKFEGFDNFKR